MSYPATMNFFVTYLYVSNMTLLASAKDLQIFISAEDLPPWLDHGLPQQVITYMMGLLGPEWTEVENSECFLRKFSRADQTSHMFRFLDQFRLDESSPALVSVVSGLWSSPDRERFERNHLQWDLNKVQACWALKIQQRKASRAQTALGSIYGCAPPSHHVA